MDRNDVRRAWEEISGTYARRRDPDGGDADLIEEFRAELDPGAVVLDVGCGDGARTLANLPAGSVGLDVSRRGLELAAETVPAARLLMTLPGGRFETVRRDWMGGRMFFSAPGREATLGQLREVGFANLRTESVSDPLGTSAEFVFAECP